MAPTFQLEVAGMGPLCGPGQGWDGKDPSDTVNGRSAPPPDHGVSTFPASARANRTPAACTPLRTLRDGQSGRGPAWVPAWDPMTRGEPVPKGQGPEGHSALAPAGSLQAVGSWRAFFWPRERALGAPGACPGRGGGVTRELCLTPSHLSPHHPWLQVRGAARDPGAGLLPAGRL